MQDMNPDLLAHPLAKYCNHLEFNGYRVEERDNSLDCDHHSKPCFFVDYYPNTKQISIYYAYDFKSNIQRESLLEYVNDLNSKFKAMKAYIDENNLLVTEIFLEDDYDRTKFSILLEKIQNDIIKIFWQHELTPEYLII